MSQLALSTVALALGLFSDPAPVEPADMVLPKLVKTVKPKAPPIFRNLHVEARLIFTATLSDTGDVIAADHLSCKTRAPNEQEFTPEPAKRCEQFEKAGREAILKWKYRPASQGGKPVRVLYSINMDFVH